MNDIITGKHPGPRRAIIYGVHGIGKSSWAAQAPKPIFVQTEDGLGDIDCERFPLVAAFDEFMSRLQWVYEGDHAYRSVVVDSLDWLERLIFAEVCQKKAVDSIEDIGYAKGYVFALDYWRRVLEALDLIRAERGMHVILISHAAIVRFENPETEAYDRFQPQVHKHAAALVTQWCDEVLFATYRVHVRQTGEGFRKRGKGIGSGERIVRTTERPAHVAKNRLALPEEIALDWKVYEAAFSGSKSSTKPAAKPPRKGKRNE